MEPSPICFLLIHCKHQPIPASQNKKRKIEQRKRGRERKGRRVAPMVTMFYTRKLLVSLCFFFYGSPPMYSKERKREKRATSENHARGDPTTPGTCLSCLEAWIGKEKGANPHSGQGG